MTIILEVIQEGRADLICRCHERLPQSSCVRLELHIKREGQHYAGEALKSTPAESVRSCTERTFISPFASRLGVGGAAGLGVVAVLISGSIEHGVGDQSVVAEDLGFDLIGNTHVFGQERLSILPPLANALVAVGEPGA